jgi:hypothetical protein
MKICNSIKFVVALLLAAYVLPTFSNEQDWPGTINEAVLVIISELSEADKNLIMNFKQERLIKFHHGFGTGIRNDFGLWKGNKAFIESACGKPCHPDTASMAIIEAVWRKLNEIP